MTKFLKENVSILQLKFTHETFQNTCDNRHQKHQKVEQHVRLREYLKFSLFEMVLHLRTTHEGDSIEHA